jgi:hypothetical protein
MSGSDLTRASLHHAILESFVDRGHAPSHRELSESFGVDAETTTRALHDLASYHGVVLHPHAPEIWVAHPFSTAPTTFSVRHGDRQWWGNCAWCSLGIASLLGGSGVTIETTLGAEGRPVAIHVDDHRVRESLVVHFPIAMARAWDNVIFTCATMLVFEDPGAVDSWSIRHALPRGDTQPIQTAYDFAREWYGRHLDPDWRKWTVDEARSLFERFGFRGPIWELPRTGDRF